MWKEAVVEQLVSIGIYNPSHDDDPVKAVANLLDWEIQTALDPKVSTPAQELYTQGVVDATLGIAIGSCRWPHIGYSHRQEPLARWKIDELMYNAGWQNSAIRQADLDKVEKVVRAVEAKLKEKNA
jgi:hypothetical protein